MDELRKCYMCNCETYPYCSIIGKICKNCMKDLQHKKQNNENNGYFDDIKLIKKNIRKSNKKRIIKRTNPDGDCLYQSMTIIFNNKITVNDIRKMVADKQTKDHYDHYKSLEMTKDFEFMRNIDTFIQFKQYIKKEGRIYGSDKCFWGDENILNILSEEYRLNINIFDKNCKLLNNIGNYDKSVYLLYNEEHYCPIAIYGNYIIYD